MPEIWNDCPICGKELTGFQYTPMSDMFGVECLLNPSEPDSYHYWIGFNEAGIICEGKFTSKYKIIRDLEDISLFGRDGKYLFFLKSSFPIGDLSDNKIDKMLLLK